ncbi:type IV secretory system conjugative DNA transfer family protein [Kitasatospora sp. NPDC048722]|uniref:type IV secretory system conjugative DNA transfer family protein n=1 Tax=Kitasatospora sp. NPDC048722 TaxID=3155639 RepID=UPI0033EFE1CA
MTEVDALALPGPLDGLPGGMLAGGGGLLLVLLVVLAMFANANKSPQAQKEFNEAIERVLGTLGRGIGRYVSGRDLTGEPRSAATWWRAGPPAPDDRRTETPVALLGLDPATPAAVSLAKPRPRGRAARTAFALTAPVRIIAGAAAGLGRVLRIWHRWPRSARSALRLAPLVVAWGWWRFPQETRLVLIAIAAAVVLAALTGPSGLRWWPAPKPVWTDGQIYGPGVWTGLRQALRFEDGEPDRRWLHIPDDTTAQGARIVLRIPIKWPGTPEARAFVERVVEERVPGEWVAQWERTTREHYVVWTPKPKPKQKPKLPDYVPWRSTGDPRRVFIGLAIEGFDIVEVVIETQSATPHWGVAGATGSGKSTVLYIPVVHGRQSGELIDVLDTKRNSLIEADGHSGVRIHKDAKACIAAFAEFLVSMMAAEAAMERGADPALRAMLVPRTLVVDELPTLIKLAYTWWRYGLKGKGTPPFLDWLGIILLQGRSSGHRVVVGTQQFANSYFGGTMERAQIGTRIAVGQQDRISWGVAFGQSTPVLGIDSSVKGRGAYTDNRLHPDGDHLYVREVQPCYITPEVSRLLAQCPPAPGWFDAGEMAPWVTPEVLATVNEMAATGDFLPGGRFGPGSRRAVAPAAGGAISAGLPTSQHTTPADATAEATAGATAPGPQEAPAEDVLPVTYSLAEAYEKQILPWKASTARTYFKRGVERGIEPPEGISDGSTQFFSEEELRGWLARWEQWQKDNKIRNQRKPADDANQEDGVAG